MPVVLFKSTPLAEQWAHRNNAREVSLIPVTGEDIDHSLGLISEFDEALDHVDSTASRHKMAGLNAFESDAPGAQGECNLITAACSSLERGRLAEEKLRKYGYNIADGTFDKVRARHAASRLEVYEDIE